METFIVTVLSSSATYTRFFWRFGARLVFPDGLNWVARVRLLYLPPIWVFLPVMSHCFAIKLYLVAPYYHVCVVLQAFPVSPLQTNSPLEVELCLSVCLSKI